MSGSGPPAAGGGLTNYFKGMLGLPKSDSASSTGTQTPAMATPLKIGRHDSAPELVSTPSDVGIWEVSHEMKGKFTWKRLFQDPRTFDAPSPRETAPK